MINIIVEISKYVLLLLMLIFTINTYSALRTKSPEKRVSRTRGQLVVMVFFDFAAFAVMYIQTYEFKIIIIYLGLIAYILFSEAAYKIFYRRASFVLLNTMCMLISIGLVIQTRLDADNALKQLIMGVPMGLQHSITASGMTVMQAAINCFGSNAVAAITASTKLQYLLMQGCTAMGHTMTTYCGQNRGKEDFQRLREGFKTAVLMEAVFSIFAALILIFIFPKLLFIFFRPGTDMDTLTVLSNPYFYLTSVFYFPLSLIFIFRNGLQGCGYAMIPLFSGVVELAVRCIMAVLSMHFSSYILAVSCDPAAWLFAGVYCAGAYLVLSRKWP